MAEGTVPGVGTVIVTGASRGIGAAVAHAAARAGHAVVVNYSEDCAGAKTVAEDIIGLGGRA
ncbi:MAG: SDR family NAD(P)-dependent oxidoreductase, partial [Paenarthrobacter sp.]